MVNLMLEMGTWITTNGLWGKLLGVFYNLLHNMGWTIVIFTICLKLVLVPLDIYQRYISNKTTQKQNEMKPELEKIQKIYGSNQELLNKKTMEVYRNHNFNLGSSCLGLLINIVITLVVFITLFNSLRGISNNMIAEEYQVLRTTYIQTYQENKTNFSGQFDLLNEEEKLKYADEEDYIKKMTSQLAQTAVYDKYQEIKKSWLWIKNIYLTDTAVSPFPTFDKYVTNSGVSYKEGYLTLENELMNIENIKETDETKAKEIAEKDYNQISAQIQKNYEGQWNGFYILIVMAGLVTWLSTKVTKLGQPKQMQSVKLADGSVVEKEANPLGMMTYLLPLLMVFFTWSYTGLFAIYIVVNSIASILISLGIYYTKKFIITPLQLKKATANQDPNDYRRFDKYTIVENEYNKKDSKKNKNNGE